MIGINYRYEFNDKKNTIKLAPTKGQIIGYTALICLSYAAALVPLAVDKLNSRKKTTNTEDFTVPR